MHFTKTIAAISLAYFMPLSSAGPVSLPNDISKRAAIQCIGGFIATTADAIALGKQVSNTAANCYSKLPSVRTLVTYKATKAEADL